MKPIGNDTPLTIALAGNPNVGKSTVFNALTGLHQHTGNWTGKTVTGARGVHTHQGRRYMLVDLPGTYSLLTRSPEEEVAEEFLCHADPHRVIVVCDATCLQRNLHLALQIRETGVPMVVCVNLMDEARRKGIRVDIPTLERRLGVPVVATVARQKRTLTALMAAVEGASDTPALRYDDAVEEAIRERLPAVGNRWAAVGALCREDEAMQDAVAAAIAAEAADICREAVTHPDDADRTDRRADRLLTGRYTAYPLMLLLLAAVLWLTVVGANTPSQVLMRGLFWVEARLCDLCTYLHAPPWLDGALVHGAYRVLAWVVSVMLPPMAIFFPLFTLLEDVGYLPRIAFNLDRPFHRCHACGKQALTMCMGLGCNAVGVVGCRIIDSPRERLLAILTNSLVPCNGRFPTLITLLTLFTVGVSGVTHGLVAAGALTGVILLGVAATLGVTRLLAVTLLKGKPSSFTLELPPYRPPQVGRILLRSLLDRTVFVLGRAAAVAAPAGLLIWIATHVPAAGGNLLTAAADALHPLATRMGLDGAILLAFILGFPANEIVLPLTLMIYTAGGTLTDVGDPAQLYTILTANGWTPLTALCTAVFCLFHWPCSTTLLTIRKETGGTKWALAAAVIPTVLGMGLCMLITAVTRI